MKLPDITPGPWEENDGIITDAEGRFVCDCFSDVSSTTPGEKSNARAITALPECLAALNAIEPVINAALFDTSLPSRSDTYNAALTIIRAALLKAGATE